jgi:Aspartyl protease
MKRERLWWVGLGWAQRVVTAVVLVHGLSWAQMPEAVGSESGPGQVGVGTSGAVPFTLVDGYLIVVEGRIGAKGHLKLVLDTGATHSILRPGLAKEEKFLRRTVRIVNLDHVLTQELAEVPDFELGPIRIPLLPVMLNDLSYLRESAPGVDGLIGLDVLLGRSFSIDFGRRNITFGFSRTLRFSATMEVNKAYLAVEVQMLNQPVRLLLDTGVSAILLYRDRLGNRLPELRVEQQIRGASLGGAASLEVVTLPCVRLNGTDLRRRAVLLRNSPPGFLPQVDGYMSLIALGARRVSFDFERNTFSWE